VDDIDIEIRMKQAQKRIAEMQLKIDQINDDLQRSEAFEKRAMWTFMIAIPVFMVAAILIQAFYS
jgi:multidrug resistance efflux pump